MLTMVAPLPNFSLVSIEPNLTSVGIYIPLHVQYLYMYGDTKNKNLVALKPHFESHRFRARSKCCLRLSLDEL